MRLAEGMGLEVADVILDAPIPYIFVRPNKTRGLKNAFSERRLPLVGAALWACQRAMAASDGQHLFPTLLPKEIGVEFHSGSASAAMLKWLRDNKLRGKVQVLHSFRHCMADRLREVETPPELADRIGGWSKGTMRESYGQGYSVEFTHSYMTKLTLPMWEAFHAR